MHSNTAQIYNKVFLAFHLDKKTWTEAWTWVGGSWVGQEKSHDRLLSLRPRLWVWVALKNIPTSTSQHANIKFWELQKYYFSKTFSFSKYRYLGHLCASSSELLNLS